MIKAGQLKTSLVKDTPGAEEVNPGLRRRGKKQAAGYVLAGIVGDLYNDKHR